jgi:hypothetical protein
MPERCPKDCAFDQDAMATPGLNLSSRTELESRENCVQAEHLMLECYTVCNLLIRFVNRGRQCF